MTVSPNTTTVHVVRRDSPGVLIPPNSNQERHVVVEYGHVFLRPITIGTAYIHDWPETGWESRWLDDDLRRHMTSRMNIVDGSRPTLPTVPHMVSG